MPGKRIPELNRVGYEVNKLIIRVYENNSNLLILVNMDFLFRALKIP